MKFLVELAIGETVLDYGDVAAVLRDLADELEDPHNGPLKIEPVEGGKIYPGAGIRGRTVIGTWKVIEDHTSAVAADSTAATTSTP